MNGQRDVDAIIATWLDDGPVDLPMETRRAISVGLRTQPRARRVAFLGGFPMLPLNRVVAATVVVLAVGAGSILVFSNRSSSPGVGGPPTPTALPTSSAEPSPPPGSPSPEALKAGGLDPGQYRYTGNKVRVTLTVPEGWTGSGSFSIGKPPFELPDGVNLGFFQPTVTYPDPCRPEAGTEPLGPSVDDLVAALAELPNVSASEPADAMISGWTGKHLSFAVNTDGIDCVMALYGQDNFIRAAENGQQQDLWILDVAGARLVIDGAAFPDTSTSDRAELRAIVDTLLIEPTD